MSHELEFVDGQASYVGREPAWHRLGQVISNLTYEEALEKANLAGWDVHVVSADELILSLDGPGVEETFFTVRTNPATGKLEALAAVGSDYRAAQNEQAFAVAGALEDLGWTVETAGSIREGRQVFLTLAHNGHLVVGDDPINPFLTLSTSHDGSVPNQASWTINRVVCANTFDYYIPGAPKAYKVRHTENVESRLAEAQEIFLKAQGYFSRFQQEAEALLATPMNNQDFLQVVKAVYKEPDTESKAAHTRWENKADLLGDLFAGGGDVAYTLDGVKGTAWAGLNALVERIDWHRKARGGDGTRLLEAASGFDSNITKQKQEIRDVVVDWASERNPAAFDKVAV